MKPKSKNLIANNLPIPAEMIRRRIYIVRGQEVMLDSDLAELYQVPTKVLNQAVRRNKYRFPNDFMFHLTKEEIQNLRLQFETSSSRSQFVTLNRGQNIKYLPYAFTEQGVAMLSSVLNSKRAIAMNIFIIRAFIQLRKMLASHQELSNRLKKVEGVQKLHGQVLAGVVDDIKKIKSPPKTNAIGFNFKNK